MATFKLYVSTIDNNILEFKQGMWFNCDLVVPLGVQTIRQYDKNECIVSKKVYLFGYQGRRFGVEDFSTMQEFLDYLNSQCDTCCYITFNGCIVVYNGKKISYG